MTDLFRADAESLAPPPPASLHDMRPCSLASHAASAAVLCLALAFVCILVLQPVSAHASGADPQACSAGSASQMPDHGFPFQSSPAPFAVAVANPVYTAGGAAVPFSLSSNDGSSTYEGFMCSVFYATDSAGATRVGQIGPGAGETLTQPVCVSGPNGGITHNPASPRAARSFVWTPPPLSSAGLGAVVIQCTVVTSLSSYWKLPAFTLNELVPASTAPPSPSDLILTDAQLLGDGSSTLGFGFQAPVAQGAVDKYVLEFWAASSPGAVSSVNVTKVDTTTSYNVSVAGLAANTGYSFRLRSFSAAAGFQTAPALTLAATTSSLAAAVPAPTPSRSNSSISGASGAVVIDLRSFAPASDAPLIGYEVQYRLSTERTFGAHPSIFATLAQGNATIPGLVSGQSIFVQVLAKSMRGTGLPGPQIFYNVLLCPNACSGHGTCSAANLCICATGFLGSDCSIPSRVGGGPKCFKSFCMDFGLEGSNPAVPLIAPAEVSRVHVQIKARTLGWIGFLLDTFDGMTNGPGFYFTRDPTDGSTSAYFIFSKIVDEPDVESTGGEEVKASARAYLDPSDSAWTVITFSKLVGTYPSLTLEGGDGGGRQLFSYAYSGDNAWAIHDEDGKLIVDWWAGSIVKMDEVNLMMVYAPMIVFVVLTLLLAYVFSIIPALRYCAVGNFAFQRRVGDWSGKIGGAIGLLTTDLWSTMLDLLWGEVFVVLLYAAGVTLFVLSGYKEFPKVVVPPIFVYGHLTAVHYALLLVPLSKNSVWGWLFQSSFERLVKWHRIAGRLAIVWNYIHLATMLSKYGRGIAANNPNVLYGTLALIFFSITAASGWEPVRRGYWKLFITVHLLFAPVGYVMAFLHTNIAIYFAAMPLGLVVLDYIFRWVVRPSIMYTTTLTEARVLVDTEGPQGVLAGELHSHHNLLKVGEAIATHGGIGSSVGQVVHLTLTVEGFKKDFEPGSYCFLQIPSVSLHEFHPFSISNYPVAQNGSSRLTFHILDMGRDSFSSRLFHQIRTAHAGAGDVAGMTVRVDGPYGRLQVDLTRYKTIVLVAGGIGITPFLSIIEWAAEQEFACTVHLIWTSRVAASFTLWAGTLLRRIHEGKCVPKFHLHLYTTAATAAARSGLRDRPASGGRRSRGAMDVRPMPPPPQRRQYQQHQEEDDDDVALGLPLSSTDLEAAPQVPWKPKLTAGRPNLPALFADLAHEARQVDLASLPSHHAAVISREFGHTVAVLACGPASLVAQAQSAARAHNFHFHKEVFTF